MTRKSLVFAAAALVGLFTFASSAEAQQEQARAPRCNNFRAIARAVQLTPAQVEQTQAIYRELQETIEPLRGQIAPLREALEDLLDADNPNPTDVGQAVIDIDAIHDQVAAARAAADAEFEALLTAEQLPRWERFQEVCRQGYER